MVLSNKKLKQQLRAAKAEILVAGESEHNANKLSKTNTDSNSELQELLEVAKQRPRLSKRKKRRRTQVLQGIDSSQANVNGEISKESEKVEGEEGKEGDEKRKKKKRKRESEEKDGVVTEAKKVKKMSKKKRKKKKGKNDSVESGGAAEEAPNGNGECQVMEDFPLKVYVGGIPYYSTEDDIRSYFESCGTITEIDCMKFPDSGKFRGIAIICFKTEAAAKRALALDGADMGGFFLKIQPYKTTKANKVPNFAPQIIEGYNRIYVGNLSWDITEDDIKKFFSDCSISSTRFGMDKDTGEFKGYAHVDFSDNLSLTMALKLDQQILCGRPVKLSCAVPLKKGAKIQAGNVPYKKEAEIQATNGSTTNETNSQGTTSSTGKMKRRTCYECGKKGHISTACPKKQNADPANADKS